MMNPDVHHPQAGLNGDSSKVINDQILIRINRQSKHDESPNPEGIHQDGTEISSVTLLQRHNVTSGGESRIWSLDQPTGNYSSSRFGKFKRAKSIEEATHFDWANCLFNKSLVDPWETIFFNDRLVKHEARGFDGPGPCHCDIIVNFLRKPLLTGSDKMDGGNGESVAIL